MGEEARLIPHELDGFCRNPIAVREGCYHIANILPLIREAWQEGDQLYGEWITKGWPTAGDHFLSEKRATRYEVERLLNKIENDAGVLVFPYLDPSLRDRLLQFVVGVRPHETTLIPDSVMGDFRGERWHLAWGDLGMDSEILYLGTALRTVGDQVALQSQSPVGNGIPATNKVAKRARRSDRDKLQDEATIQAYLNVHPKATRDAIAKGTNIPPATVSQSAAWKIESENRRRETRGKRLTARGGVGDPSLMHESDDDE
jgi:hypothetical protein